MKQYLYFYNYDENEFDLCRMEFQEIFHESMQSKYHITHQNFDYRRSAYIRGKLEIIRSSEQFDDIVSYLEKNKMCFYDFKVVYIKNEITSVDYKESLECCKRLALPIDGSVNMQNPKIVFGLTKINKTWYFGIYENNMIWYLRKDKPYSYSHSLNTKDARAIVNIAVGNDLSVKVVDPCCGVGTVVLEALSMGIDIDGYDINRYVAYHARLNLEHFGYDPLIVQKCDMLTLDKQYDVMIMDIPYGVYSPFTYQQQMELLYHSYSITKKFVLVSHIDMKKELKDIGYQVINQATIKKGNFLRYITLCTR